MIRKSIFVKIKRLIGKPEKWTQRVLARNKTGNRVPYHSSRAKCWCLVGGLHKVGARFDEIVFLEKFLPSEFDRIDHWNDDLKTTHNDVLALIDRCIDAAGAR